MGDSSVREGLLKTFGPIPGRHPLFFYVRCARPELRGPTTRQEHGQHHAMEKRISGSPRVALHRKLGLAVLRTRCRFSLIRRR